MSCVVIPLIIILDLQKSKSSSTLYSRLPIHFVFSSKNSFLVTVVSGTFDRPCDTFTQSYMCLSHVYSEEYIVFKFKRSVWREAYLRSWYRISQSVKNLQVIYEIQSFIKPDSVYKKLLHCPILRVESIFKKLQPLTIISYLRVDLPRFLGDSNSPTNILYITLVINFISLIIFGEK
jgi:hypothetical protein